MKKAADEMSAALKNLFVLTIFLPQTSVPSARHTCDGQRLLAWQKKSYSRVS